jgi:hypothetical protein
MKKIFILFTVLIACFAAQAQELNATVTINTPKLANVDRKVFDVLKQQLQEYLSNQKWTEDVYEPEERIDVNVNLTIVEEYSPTSFGAKLTIQASRPIYNSDYETITFINSDDEISFNYELYQPIQYSQTTFTDNFSAIFAFYAYYIIAMDYDTFSPLGGEPYFTRAQEVQRLVPQGINKDGWQPGKSNRNRYWLIENATNPRMRPFREAMYMYHRQGLDMFTVNPEDAKNKLVQALDDISKAHASYPNAHMTTVFNTSKGNELVEIGKGLNKPQKSKLFEVMSKVDPANMNKYQAIGINF